MPGAPPSEIKEPLVPGQRLSATGLWDLQRAYYERIGMDAWRLDTIPHYVTNNPAIALAYAEVVLGFLRDLRGPAGDDADASDDEPLHIVELGSGSGRFAFYFLRSLLDLIARSPLAGARVRYVMTDGPQANLAAARLHPRLRPFVAAGQLDFARFDASRDATLTLEESGLTLGPSSLGRPVVLIANYILDSIPPDAFAFAEGRVRECLVTVEGDTSKLAPGGEPFESYTLGWQRRTLEGDAYLEPEFNAILADYVKPLDGSTILFPVAALRVIERLSRLADGRLLLLSGDKGAVQRGELRMLSEPDLVTHGSFSFSVNFHAIGQWFTRKGGLALATKHRQMSLSVVADVLGCDPARLVETRLAFARSFEAASWDDLFRLRQGLDEHLERLGFEALVALVRMSHLDARVLVDCAPAFIDLLPDLHPSERGELARLVRDVWPNYFFIGEKDDTPFSLAMIAQFAGAPDLALDLYAASRALHGDDARTSWNMALCYFALRRPVEGTAALGEALARDPELGMQLGVVSKT